MATETESGRGYSTAAERRLDKDQPDRMLRRAAPWAILGGMVIALVVLFLLNLFGIGVGLTRINPAPGGSGSPGVAAFGIVSAIWALITFLAAFFAGGWVASRLAGDPKKLDGLMHGVITWALTVLVVMWLTATAISGIVGTVFSATGNLAQGAQSAASGASVPWQQVQSRVQEAVPQDVDVDRQALLSAFREFASGDSNRQAVIDVLVQQGGLSQQRAESVFQSMQSQYQSTVDAARQAAQAAASAASWAALLAFVALALGGAAAAGGGWLGAPRDELASGAAVR